MEVDGKEFLRNMSIEQDKARLMEEQEKLEKKKRDSVRQQSSEHTSNLNNDSAYVDLSFGKNSDDTESTINQLQDIMLEPDSNNKNKKKYIILGFALILLFIITIVVIRMISNSSQENQLMNDIDKPLLTIDKDKILDKIDTKEEFEKVINQNEMAPNDLNIKDVEKKELILPEPIKEKPPVLIEKPKVVDKPQRDVFGLEKPVEEEKLVVNKAKVKEETKKTVERPVKAEDKKEELKAVFAGKREVVVSSPIETNFTKTKKSSLNGYYIQLGAFSKKPSDKYLSNISKKGYSYTIYTTEIKGKVYNKVLVGAYPSKKTALQDIEKIKKDFNNKNAYILKF